ncbi:MAG: ATP-binding protein, partial [Sphingobacteriaceae bacterium]|nr:ATP-binding protein [Sphingobacteriaceae bacterium]
ADGQVDKAKLKLWYNGYNFAGNEEQKVYNPFDILLFCSKNYDYRSYWFETATPTFLVRLIESEQYYIPDLEEVLVPESSLSSFDVDEITLTTLLFQTGYLTIKRVTQLGTQRAYVLGYPNLEVKASLNDKLATIGTSLQRKDQVLGKVAGLFLSNKFADLKSIFSSHFASIPHDWYRNNNIANYEGFYASIVYSYLAALGYDLRAEDTTNQGRIDLTMIMPDKVIILEFKLTKYGSASEALEQIKAKGYASKYLAENKPIYLVEISFDAESKNVVECLYEKI